MYRARWLKVAMVFCMAMVFIVNELVPIDVVRAQSPQLKLVTDVTVTSQGKAFTVDIVAEDIADLYGAEIYVNFDAYSLEVVDSDGKPVSGGDIVSDGNGYEVANGDAYPAPGIGQIEYAAARLGQDNGLSGSVKIASITFKVVSSSSSNIAIYLTPDKACKLVDGNGQLINFSQGGWLYINNDNTPPIIDSVQAVAYNKIKVNFNEPISAAGSYTVEPQLDILDVAIGADGRSVELTTSDQMATFGGYYILHVQGVADMMGNASNTQQQAFDGRGKIYMTAGSIYRNHEFVMNVKLGEILRFHYAGFTLNYDPNYIEAIDINVSQGMVFNKKTIDNSIGRIECGVLPSADIDDFSGTVASITFKAKDQIGASMVSLTSPIVTKGGSPYYEYGIDPVNCTLNISDTYIITGYIIIDGAQSSYDTDVIVNGNRQTVHITDGTFNLLDILPGRYSIEVKKDGYLSDKKEADVSGSAVLEFHLRAGDVDGKGDVTLEDLALLSQLFGCAAGQDGWKEEADFNADDIIDIRDIVLAAKNYGMVAP